MKKIRTLFPAQAGVIQLRYVEYGVAKTVPRASGGDPRGNGDYGQYATCSPRKRG